MIKANELKPDNLIHFNNPLNNDGNRVVVIDSVKKSIWSFQEKHDHGIDIWLPLSACSPIPLTAEWLERCGFEYKDGASDYGHYRHNLVYIYQHDTDPGLFHFSRGHMEGAKVEIKYVHQLQNLYFALTGSELTINL